jgi:alpha-glucosidase
VDEQLKLPESVLHHYRAMLAFRKQHPALRQGTIALIAAPENVLAFTRSGGGETLLCVFNMSAEETSIALPAQLAAHAAGAPGTLADPEGEVLSLPAYGTYIGVVTAG